MSNLSTRLVDKSLCGGDKDSQSRDIENAKAYWKEYKHRASI
jgi:putative component of toxin-antitoxin plasmid stabilization module